MICYAFPFSYAVLGSGQHNLQNDGRCPRPPYNNSKHFRLTSWSPTKKGVKMISEHGMNMRESIEMFHPNISLINIGRGYAAGYGSAVFATGIWCVRGKGVIMIHFWWENFLCCQPCQFEIVGASRCPFNYFCCTPPCWWLLNGRLCPILNLKAEKVWKPHNRKLTTSTNKWKLTLSGAFVFFSSSRMMKITKFSTQKIDEPYTLLFF